MWHRPLISYIFVYNPSTIFRQLRVNVGFLPFHRIASRKKICKYCLMCILYWNVRVWPINSWCVSFKRSQAASSSMNTNCLICRFTLWMNSKMWLRDTTDLNDKLISVSIFLLRFLYFCMFKILILLRK